MSHVWETACDFDPEPSARALIVQILIFLRRFYQAHAAATNRNAVARFQPARGEGLIVGRDVSFAVGGRWEEEEGSGSNARVGTGTLASRGR